MKLQKALVTIPGTQATRTTWMVLDDDFRPVKPIQNYLKYCENIGRSPNTLRLYAYNLKLFWEYLAIKGLNWTQANIDQLAGFIIWLRTGDTGRITDITPREARRSNKTINLILTSVTGFYQHHGRMNTIDNIPQFYKDVQRLGIRYKPFLHHISKGKPVEQRVLKQREQKHVITVFTPDEVKKLTAACNTRRDRFLLRLLYETGMRIGQALGLRHEDIRSWDNEIGVKYRPDNANGAFAKTQKDNTLHVSQELMALYSDYLVEEYGDFNSDYVFINLWGGNIGKPMSYLAVASLFKRLSKKTGIAAHPHKFRHTHATELLRAGWDSSYVQQRLGHASVQTTIDAYAHLSNADMKAKFKQYIKDRKWPN